MSTTKAVIAALVVATIGMTSHQAKAGCPMDLGVRASYGVPTGKAGDGTNLNDLARGIVPVQLDAMYHFNPSWRAGAYFAYGPALVANEAKSALAASGLQDIGGHREQRVGIQAAFYPLPQARVAPWIGLSAGYAWTRYAQATTAVGKETELGLSGFEGALQLGGDYKVSGRFTVGPFASVSVGQFRSRLTWLEDSGEESSRVANRGIHEWFQAGVRTSFAL